MSAGRSEAGYMADERRMNLRFSPEEFDQLDEKRFRERTTFQELGATLFREWLSGKRTVEPPPRPKKPPHDPLIEKLAIIRASGNKNLLGIVRKIVDASYLILKRSLTPDEFEQLKAAVTPSAGTASTRRTPRLG